MKKVLSLLCLSLFSIYITGCINNNHKLYPSSNIDGTGYIENAPNSIEIIHTNNSDYTYLKSLSREDFKKILPDEYKKDITNVRICDYYENVAYISTFMQKAGTQGSGVDDFYDNDIFSYNYDTGEMTYLFNVSELGTIIYQIYFADDNVFIYTSDRDLYEYNFSDKNFVLLTSRSYYFASYKNGIIYIDDDNDSISTISDNEYKQHKYDMYLPTQILQGNPPYYVTDTVKQTFLYLLNDKLDVVKTLEEPRSRIFPLENIFFVVTHDDAETNTIHIKNYNDKTLNEIKLNEIITSYGVYDDTLFRLNSDGTLYRYRYNQSENELICSVVNNNNNKILDFTITDNYLFATESTRPDNTNLIYDVYVKNRDR